MAFVYCPLVFEFSVVIGGVVIGLSQISFFFSCKCRNSIALFEFAYVTQKTEILRKIDNYRISFSLGYFCRPMVVLYIICTLKVQFDKLILR